MVMLFRALAAQLDDPRQQGTYRCAALRET